MLRLVFKMAVYGLAGYCMYEFLRGASGGQIGRKAREMGREASDRMAGNREEAGPRRQRSFRGRGGSARMTGRGEGVTVETHDADGGSVPVRVGRGVKAPAG